MVRRGWASSGGLGELGFGTVGCGLAVTVRSGGVWLGMVRRSRYGVFGSVLVWRGGHVLAGQGRLRCGGAVLVCLGTARCGTARSGGRGGVGLGEERRGLAVLFRSGLFRAGGAWRSWFERCVRVGQGSVGRLRYGLAWHGLGLVGRSGCG